MTYLILNIAVKSHYSKIMTSNHKVYNDKLLDENELLFVNIKLSLTIKEIIIKPRLSRTNYWPIFKIQN
ncbi:hypothetical protein HYE07_00855 [Mycoplasmopsis bovis]|nr:hypothetical protein [Mycoplasmopsis bovis]QQH27255.1 hypothetical protein HYE07_00855 [Mycoplasmopsis bovis]